MKDEMLQKILQPVLEEVMCAWFDFDSDEDFHFIETKELVGKVDNIKIMIYSLDHDPPHFHVKSKDNNINAKFKIENCEFISGKISSNDMKKIKVFYDHPKTVIVMRMIWDKRNK